MQLWKHGDFKQLLDEGHLHSHAYTLKHGLTDINLKLGMHVVAT